MAFRFELLLYKPEEIPTRDPRQTVMPGTDNLRKQKPKFKFRPICGMNSHGAMLHLIKTYEIDAHPKNCYLVLTEKDGPDKVELERFTCSAPIPNPGDEEAGDPEGE